MTATCACGQASITVNGLPTMHGVCHCTHCKRRTGSAFGISACFADDALPEPTYSATDGKRWRWVNLPQGWKVHPL